MSSAYTDGGNQDGPHRNGPVDPDGPGSHEGEIGSTFDDVARYAAEVRADLADLPSEQSAELLDDLEDHLREVAAEDAGDLRTRLGTPTGYARELRSSAGFPPPEDSESASSATSSKRRRGIEDRIAARARRTRARVVGHPFGAETAAFLPTLRPAWWVVRGWLAVVLLQFLTSSGSAGGNGRTYPFPKVSGSTGLGFVLLVAAIVASVWLAKRPPMTGRQRRFLLLGHSGLVVVALFAIGDMQTGPDNAGSSDQASYQYTAGTQGLVDNGRQVTNLFVYDKDGRPLDGAFVYDQSGNPVVVSDMTRCQIYGSSAASVSLIPVGEDDSIFQAREWLDSQGYSVPNVYPQHQIRFADGQGPGGGLTAVPWLTVQVPQGVHEVPLPRLGPDGTPITDTPQPTASPSTASQPTTTGPSASAAPGPNSATSPQPIAPGAQQSSATSAPVQTSSGSATTR